MSVSVIIPSYNCSNYVTKAVDSILETNSGNFEVIIIDDGSTDETKSILMERDYPSDKVIYYYQENQGLSGARNTGIRLAKKDYILFLDSDDFHQDGSIDKLYSECSRYDLDAVFFEAEIFNDHDGSVKYKAYYKRPNFPDVSDSRDILMSSIQEEKFMFSACLYIIRADIIKKMSFFSDIYYEDNLFTLDLMLNQPLKKCKVINHPFYFRRVRNNSIMTGVTSQKHLSSSIFVYQKMKNIILKQNLNTTEYQHINYLRRLSLVRIAKEVYKSDNLYTRFGIQCRLFVIKELMKNIDMRFTFKQICVMFLPELAFFRE